MRAQARFLGKETRRTDTRIAATRPHQKAPTKNTRPTPSIHPTSVTLVTTLQQLQQLHLDLLAPPLPSQPHPWTRAVALDCEWQPFHNRATKTPVSLLQIADDAGRVWLLDLLALLCPLPNLLCTPWALQGGNGLCWPRDPTEEETALAALLHQLLTRDDIIKVGFRFQIDALRLMESYPLLPPCWGPHAKSNARTPTSTAAQQMAAIDNATGSGEVDASSACCWVVTVAVEGGAHGGPATETFQEAFVVRDMAGGQRMEQWNTVLPMRSFVDVAYAASHVGGRPGEVSRRLSLRTLCSSLLNVQLDKSQQMSAWGQRPLTDEQVDYAAADVASTMACFLEVVGRHVDRGGADAVRALYDRWRAQEGAALVSRGTCWPSTAHPAMPQPVKGAPRNWVVAAADKGTLLAAADKGTLLAAADKGTLLAAADKGTLLAAADKGTLPDDNNDDNDNNHDDDNDDARGSIATSSSMADL